MAVRAETRDATLVIAVLDERLMEPTQIKRLSDDLQGLLGKAEQTQVVLDFERVQFMSSAMLGKLVQFHKKCKEFKVNLKLSGVSSEIYEVFKITRLHKLFDFQPDVGAACKSFSKRGFWG
ncbi:MAG: STAS domain-containing protein [Planctomycetales bacterium]|nr:STAS domain-containing protein [Planctomycetales bacterium]